MNMKYLKQASTVFVNNSLNSINRVSVDVIEGYTATLGLTTVCSDGSGEQLQGIYVTRSQLEQIRDEIDSYLQKTAESEPKLGIADSEQKPEATPVTFNVNMTRDSKLSEEKIRKFLLDTAQRVTKIQEHQSNGTEEKQKFKINPKLVKIERSVDEASFGLFRASIDDWHNLTNNRAGYIYLYGLGVSEEEARARLNAQFETLILRFVNSEATISKPSTEI